MQLAAHYARLGLRPPPPAHSRADVVAAYRAAALRAHPDRGGCASDFAALTASYEAVLNAGANARVYAPASTRVYGARANRTAGEGSHVLLAMLLPAALLAGVSARAVLAARVDRPGLRAGGTSRFTPPLDTDGARKPVSESPPT